ncbi:unnamed protein product [Caenorhabditis angaria]|uniref:Battenin n=1 Tax=Caenorhabditis angaria TaxID=860376 RepID=A0A9P1I2Z5_9PELO|nr:unnamed protein product [Caenorhabditis angaria]
MSRNGVGFWLLGLCNNFAYVIMLSAAKDILDPESHQEKSCRPQISSRDCQFISTGSVLLADIIPALIIKLTAPIYVHKIPFGIRHFIVVLLQAASFLLVSTSQSTVVALFGVILASFGSGLGEISYLALSANYESNSVSYWSSGTGGAGLIGAFSYAFLTDRQFLAFSPKSAILLMFFTIPPVFSITYWGVLRIPHTVQRVRFCEPRTWWIWEENERENESLLEEENENEEEEVEVSQTPFRKQELFVKFMLPLILVYFAEYFINQGLLELFEFDCAHGFELSADAQYRWYQVTYQIGVFISRSSSDLITVSPFILAFLQVSNAIFFTICAISMLILPHISILFGLVLFEGLLGGAAYICIFRNVHKQIPSTYREWSMGFVSISDTIGIMLAGFTAIPAHNQICRLKI